MDKEVLKHLVDTRNAFAIRIYVYLLNKYLWKKKTDENYVFTLRELAEAFGYSNTTKTCYEVFRNVLASFREEKLISYKKIQQKVEININGGEVINTERILLTFVAERKTDLPVF